MSIFSKNQSSEQPRKKHGCLWTIIIILVVYVALCGLVGSMMGDWMSPSAKLQDNTVYQLDLQGVMYEQGEEENPFADLMNSFPMAGANMQTRVGLDDLKRNLILAQENDKIKGVVLRGGDMAMGPASAKALRDALIAYKQSGKFLIAYAESYGQLNYYVASVADKVYVNPVGVVSWNGLLAQQLYFKRLLDKVGVDVQILKVGTFKAAVEPFCRTSMSDADKEQNMLYLTGIWNEMRHSVSEYRHISETQLDSMAHRYMALQPQTDYLSTGLVDSLIYADELDSILRQLTGTKDYHLMKTAKLASVKRTNHEADNKIAIVYAEGEITDDQGDGIVGTKMLKLFKKIGNKDDVKAVVLRVNSPGGSANASEQIWHAVQVLRQKGIPVVVSMGDYAASGGYYISCGADYIYAEPTTLTGSIGIFGMIPSLAGIRDKVGIDVDGVTTHRHSALEVDMLYRGMNEEERALMQNMVNQGYELFTSRCAEGRGMAQDSIKRIAEGRVWLGTDALRLGLVDGMGNLENAISKAADLAQLTDYELTYYPEKKDFMTELLESMDNTTEEERLLMHVKNFCSKPRILSLFNKPEIK